MKYIYTALVQSTKCISYMLIVFIRTLWTFNPVQAANDTVFSNFDKENTVEHNTYFFISLVIGLIVCGIGIFILFETYGPKPHK